MNRRAFLKSLAGLTAGVGTILPVLDSNRTNAAEDSRDRLGLTLPKRILGRTNEAVTMLGVGGWHIGRMSEKEAQATIETALEGGVRFFDSAESYQSGGSETYLGKMLTPKYRDIVYIMTKTTANDKATAKRHLEESLRRLKLDHLDLWQMHAVDSPEDVDNRIKNGVLDAIFEAQASGKVRHIGFTGHTQPSAHQRVLEKTDIFQTCQMPVNLADMSYQSFVKGIMPILVKRNIGSIAMKTLANGGFFGGSNHGEHGPNPKVVPDRISVKEALYFSWSMPISVLITGPDNPQMMKEKIQLAKAFVALDEEERQKLVAKVADMAGRVVEFYKA